MNTKSPQSPLSRFAIALATNEALSHQLETVSRLAAGYKAELSGVFIEDTDMLRAAALPFALEVCRATNVVRRIESAEIERGLKEYAALVRQQVAASAERSGAKWSFEVKRESRAVALLEIAKGTDVTMFSAATTQRHRYHEVTPELTRAAGGESIAVVIDRRASSRRALQLARELASLRQLPCRVIAVAASSAGLERLIEQTCREHSLERTAITGLSKPQFSELIDATQACKPAGVVVPFHVIGDSPARIRELDDALESPIFIVR